MMNNRIIWLIDGKVSDSNGFRDVIKDVVKMAQAETGTKIYWWTINSDQTEFSDLDSYDSEPAALEHIHHWAEHNATFEKYAENQRLVILGDAPQSVRDALQKMNPHFMRFYGGFAKDKTADSNQTSDIIWALEGRITNKELFKESMETLTSKTKAEEGSLMHWWCCDEEDNFFVLEHYADDAAAMAHLATWNEFGHLFLDSTEVTAYTIYSNLSPELAKAVAGLSPKMMQPVLGFSR